MNEPKIRFKGFQGKWETRHVGELCDVLTGFPFEGSKILPKGKELLMRGINITEGFIRHSEDIDRYYDEDSSMLSKYRLQENDLVIGMDGSKVGKNSALVTKKEVNSLLVQRVARLRNNNPHLIHLIQISLGSEKFFEYVDSMKTSSAIPHISPSDIKNFVVSISVNDDEIKLVSDYFQHLDSLIQSTTKKIESLKQVKAASMQSMFPQEGETTPRVRFKRFEGEWEKVTIKDVATFLKGRGYSKSDLRVKGTPIILYGRMYTKYETCITSVDTYVNPLPSSIYTLGNEVVMPASGETPEDISCASAVKARGIILGGDLNILRFDTDYYDTTFVALSLSNGKAKKDLSNMAQGKSVVHLHNSDIEKVDMFIPSFVEQQQIASYFTNLDRQITLQTLQLEKLKQIKAACLDNMFV